MSSLLEMRFIFTAEVEVMIGDQGGGRQRYVASPFVQSWPRCRRNAGTTRRLPTDAQLLYTPEYTAQCLQRANAMQRNVECLDLLRELGGLPDSR